MPPHASCVYALRCHKREDVCVCVCVRARQNKTKYDNTHTLSTTESNSEAPPPAFCAQLANGTLTDSWMLADAAPFVYTASGMFGSSTGTQVVDRGIFTRTFKGFVGEACLGETVHVRVGEFASGAVELRSVGLGEIRPPMRSMASAACVRGSRLKARPDASGPAHCTSIEWISCSSAARGIPW